MSRQLAPDVGPIHASFRTAPEAAVHWTAGNIDTTAGPGISTLDLDLQWTGCFADIHADWAASERAKFHLFEFHLHNELRLI